LEQSLSWSRIASCSSSWSRVALCSKTLSNRVQPNVGAGLHPAPFKSSRSRTIQPKLEKGYSPAPFKSPPPTKNPVYNVDGVFNNFVFKIAPY